MLGAALAFELELQTVFLQDWYFETDEVLDNAEVFPDPQIVGSTAIQVLPSGPNYPSENYQRMVVAVTVASQGAEWVWSVALLSVHDAAPESVMVPFSPSGT